MSPISSKKDKHIPASQAAATNHIFWYIALFFTSALWGTLHPTLKFLSGQVPPELLNFLRYSVAMLVLLPLVAREKIVPQKKDLAAIFVLGFIGVFAYGILNTMGVNLSTATNNSVLVNSWPLMIVIIAPFVTKERVSWQSLLGMAIGCLGLLVVATNGFNFLLLFSSKYVLGNAIILSSSFCLALFSLFNKKYIEKYSGLAAIFYSLVAGAFCLFCSVLLVGQFGSVSALTPRTIGLILWLAIPTTALPWLVRFSAIKQIGLVKTSAFSLLIPIFGVLASSFFLHEPLTIFTLMGTFLVTIGIVLVQNTIPLSWFKGGE
jgi:drug/metabolite transporter (DMT)-like permease